MHRNWRSTGTSECRYTVRSNEDGGGTPKVLALMPQSDGFDRYEPGHVTPLVLYLASSACRFMGRVFVIEGPDVAIYHPLGVEDHWSIDGRWSLESLTEMFAIYP